MTTEREFRGQVKDVCKTFAALDVARCDLSDIGTMILNLHAETLRLTDRLTKALDKESLATDEVVLGLKSKLEDLQTTSKTAEQDYAHVFDRLRNAATVAKKASDDALEKFGFESKHYEDCLQVARTCMQAMLMRPDSFLKIYGAKDYTAFKEGYVFIGGDLDKLPKEKMP